MIPTAPLSVDELRVTQRSPYSITLDWDNVDSEDVRYRVEYIPTDGDILDDVTSSSVSIGNLAPGKEYVVTVTSVSGDGDTYDQLGDPRIIVTFTRKFFPPSRKQAVQQPHRVGKFTFSVSLTWGALMYNVRRVCAAYKTPVFTPDCRSQDTRFSIICRSVDPRNDATPFKIPYLVMCTNGMPRPPLSSLQNVS